MSDFEWVWPKKVDLDLFEEVTDLGVLGEAANVALLSTRHPGDRSG